MPSSFRQRFQGTCASNTADIMRTITLNIKILGAGTFFKFSKILFYCQCYILQTDTKYVEMILFLQRKNSSLQPCMAGEKIG